jgi:hypothetical protein
MGNLSTTPGRENPVFPQKYPIIGSALGQIRPRSDLYLTNLPENIRFVTRVFMGPLWNAYYRGILQYMKNINLKDENMNTRAIRCVGRVMNGKLPCDTRLDGIVEGKTKTVTCPTCALDLKLDWRLNWFGDRLLLTISYSQNGYTYTVE